MQALAQFAQALGIAYASGLNLYATLAVVGIADRMGWIALPSSLDPLSSLWMIGLAVLLYLFEFTATLIPGVASAWETFHSVIRPPAAAALAVATAWHGDALMVILAALLGGTLGLTTHVTKLGLRYAIDTSPEPFSNAATNVAELGFVSALALLIWHYPIITLILALAALVVMIVTVRLIWRALRQVFSGRWMPRRGLLQQARTSEREMREEEEEGLRG